MPAPFFLTGHLGGGDTQKDQNPFRQIAGPVIKGGLFRGVRVPNVRDKS